MTPQMKATFLKANTTRKLGTIATNANRFALWLGERQNIAHARNLLTETMLFIEWLAQELDSSHSELANAQRQFGGWRRQLEDIASQPQKSSQIQLEARAISQRFLELAGLA